MTSTVIWINVKRMKIWIQHGLILSWYDITYYKISNSNPLAIIYSEYIFEHFRTNFPEIERRQWQLNAYMGPYIIQTTIDKFKHFKNALCYSPIVKRLIVLKANTMQCGSTRFVFGIVLRSHILLIIQLQTL